MGIIVILPTLQGGFEDFTGYCIQPIIWHRLWSQYIMISIIINNPQSKHQNPLESKCVKYILVWAAYLILNSSSWESPLIYQKVPPAAFSQLYG